jgi:ABC-2 type transport system permease protein
MVSLSIAWKEFRSFINSPVAYIFLMIFVVVLGGSYFLWGGQTGTFFLHGTTELGMYFRMMPLAMAVLIPALCMKLWPDELKSGTVELLLSYPVRSWQVVLGKFLAGLMLVVVGLLFTLTTPITVAGYGSMDWGPIWGAYVASLLVGGAFLAVGLFMGALCREQVTACILTAFVCAALVLMGDTLVNIFIPKNWHGISNALSFSSRFTYLGRGVIDFADALYFVSFAATFLVLNVTVVECRKGR